MSKEEKLRISFEPHNDGPKPFVVNGVDNYNMATTGRPDYYPVQYYLRSADDEVLGGVIGLIWGDWLHLSYVWVAEPARGQNYARQMVTAAEEYAKKRGCRGAYLETFSFQARPLYEKLGYSLIGEIADFPPGHKFFFMKKQFER